MKKVITIITLALISACSWVELKESGKHVAMGTKENVSMCKKIGTVNAKTRYALIPGSPRSEEKINQELSILARNEAAKINANTIVPINSAKNGEQSFTAYICP